MLHKAITTYMSNIGKRGMKALQEKYPEEVRRGWARKGGTQKGINHKKRQ